MKGRARFSRITFSGVLLSALVATPVVRGDQGRSAVPANPDDKAVIHVLNRIGFGPRTGDVERVRQLGLGGYIEQQLHPERLADAAMTTRLEGFTTLTKSTRE